MSKKYTQQQQEAAEEFNRILPSELDKLRAAMEAKKQERMNGRLQSRFRQVMFDWDVLRLLDDGEVSVRKPLEYTRWNKANSMIESADDKQIDSMLEAFPEEREAFRAKLRLWGNGLRENLKTVSQKMKVTNEP